MQQVCLLEPEEEIQQTGLDQEDERSEREGILLEPITHEDMPPTTENEVSVKE